MRIVDRSKFHRAVAIVLLVILTIFLIQRLMAWGACSWYGYQTDRETRYAAFVGCLVELDGKWYPRNELRIVQ